MRVLLVDDDVVLLTTIRTALAREGWVVDVAGDGITGQVMAQHNHYDVVVLDIVLPQRNGYDVLRNLRTAGNQTPIMILTAKDGEYDQTDAFDLGADDYLTKPASLRLLIARLQVLARRCAPHPTLLQVGTLTLDPARKTVTRAGTPIELSALEYRILHHLMRTAPTPQSKKDIAHAVWDEPPRNDNIVEVYIGYLRRKIDTPFNLHTLLTIRGTGYHLIPEPPPH